MDNLRFVLFIAFCFLSYMIWDAWQQDYGPRPAPTAAAPATTPDAPTASVNPDTPSAGTLTPATEAAVASRSGQKLTVVTDVLQAEIDTAGGDIQTLDLSQYPLVKGQPQPVRLFDTTEAAFFVSQTGFIGDSDAPSHKADWQATAAHYALEPNADTVSIPLTWSQNGITVTKVYTFKRGSYQIALQHEVVNHATSAWSARPYVQMQRKDFVPDGGIAGNFIRTYTGGVVFSDEHKYEKLAFSDLAKTPLDRDISGGWLAFIQHYFLAAWIPPVDTPYHYYSKKIGSDRYVLGAYGPPLTVAPGDQAITAATLYAGPKLHHALAATAKGLELTVDYGWITPVAEPVFWLMDKLFHWLGNWGFAILGVTLCIKVLFFKLSEAGYRSMAKMRKLQPKMQALKEQFGEDRAKFNQELMALYRKEKVNPMGGCLPILVQMPVFFALYWVLVETVEMRQAPFIFWIQDLTAKDPYYVLPVIMGVSSYLQQRLSPAPADPMQERVMKIFPVVFSMFFIFFPSGLVLYYVANNSLSILQQWAINKRIEKSAS